MSIKFRKNPRKILENIFLLVHLAEDLWAFFVVIYKNRLFLPLSFMLYREKVSRIFSFPPILPLPVPAPADLLTGRKGVYYHGKNAQREVRKR